MLLRSAIVTYAVVFGTPTGLLTGHGSAALAQKQTPLSIPPSVTAHEVPEGGKIKLVGDGIHVFDENGDLINITANDREFFPSTSGIYGAAHAYWRNPDDLLINNLGVSWEVPPVPTSLEGQLLSYVSGVIDGRSLYARLFTLIQYGDSGWGGGDYWWSCVVLITGMHIYHTPINRIAPGTALDSKIELLSTDEDETHTYVAAFAGWRGMHVEIENNLGYVTIGHDAIALHSRANLPFTPTVCSGVNINTTQGTPEFTWATSNSGPFTDITVDIRGAVDAQITISYHD